MKYVKRHYFIFTAVVVLLCFSAQAEEQLEPDVLVYEKLLLENACSAADIAYYLDLLNGTDQLSRAVEVDLAFEKCPHLDYFFKAQAAFHRGAKEETANVMKQIPAEIEDGYIDHLRARLTLKGRDYDGALAIWKEVLLKNPQCDLASRIYNGVGTAFYFKSDFVKAALYFDNARALLFGCDKHEPLLVYPLQNKAMMLIRDKEYDKAVDTYLSYLDDESLIINRDTRGISYSNLSAAYRRQGDYLLALEAQKKALTYLEQSSKKNYLSSSLYNTGNIYIQLGMYGKAKEYLERAEKIMRELGDTRRLARALGSLGLVAEHTGDLNLAERTMRASVTMAREQEDSDTELSSLQNLGNIALKRRNYTEAYTTFTNVLKLSRERDDRYRETTAMGNVGLSLSRLGKHKEALAFLLEAQEAAEHSNSLLQLWHIHWYKAQVYWSLEEVQKSLASYEKATALLDEIRKSLKLEELQKPYTVSVLDVYEDYLDKLLKVFLEKPNPVTAEAAFEVMEKKKAQILLEFLSRTGVASPEQGVAASLALLKSFLTKEKALFLSYSLGREESQLLVVSPDVVSYYPLPGEKEIAQSVRHAVMSMTAGHPPNFTLKKLAGLVEPILENKGVERLIISADGILHYLPFEVLPVEEGRFLIEDFTISYAPSASVLMELAGKKRRTGGGLIALGNPDLSSSPSVKSLLKERGQNLSTLPFSGDEVRAIGDIFKDEARIFTGSQANEGVVKSSGSANQRILHFAAHGLVEEQAPEYSGLLLSGTDEEDGYLTVREIVELSLTPEMVTLSACETGRGEIVRGEGVIGLARAFLYAGAENVVATLWEVNDFTTSRFMAAFYQKIKDGSSPAVALRQAKLDLIRNDLVVTEEDKKRMATLRGGKSTESKPLSGDDSFSARAPLYWAPFILIGP